LTFIGTYANLTNYRIGGFKVTELRGRDPAGAPVWTVRCLSCGGTQDLAHARLASMVESKRTQRSLFCSNGSCRESKAESHGGQTYAQFLKQEKREAAIRAAGEADKAAVSAEMVIRQRAKDAHLEVLRTEYRQFYLHHLKTRIDNQPIVPFARWKQLEPETRRIVLERCRTDDGCFFTSI
jgi:hypothetical protein